MSAAGELYSLVRFLRIFPYAFYFCKSREKSGHRALCGCRFLDYRFRQRRACETCGCAVHPDKWGNGDVPVFRTLS